MSYGRKRQSLESWITECLNDTEGRECKALALVHMVGMAENEVHMVRLGTKAWEVNELGALFKHKAEGYAQDLPGTQTFCLLAFFGIDSSPGARLPFRVSGDVDFGGLGTEAPTPQGQLQQQMRLSEAIVSGSFKQNTTTFDVMLRYMEMQSRASMRYADQNERLMNLLAENHVRYLEMQQRVLGMEERKQLFAMVPSLVNTITGEKVLPAAQEEESIIDAVASELTPDMVRGLQSVLPPKAWALLVTRLNQILEQKKAAQQSAQETGEAIISRGVNPEDDAAGEGFSNGSSGRH